MTTQKEFIDRVRGAFAAHVPGADAFIQPNNLWITAAVLGGEMWQLRGEDEARVEAAMPDTATGDFLERWALILDLTRLPASQAKGSITVTGADGDIVPAGTLATRTDGVEYTVDQDITIDATLTAVGAITSVETGRNVNLDAGAPLTLSGVGGGVNTAAVSGSLTGGMEIETDDQLRHRVVLGFQRRGEFGSLCNYERWAFECLAGVTRSWANFSGGVITLSFMMDNSYPDGIPLQADADALKACLDDRCRAVVNQSVDVAILTPKIMAIDVQCPTNKSLTTAEAAAIAAEVTEYITVNAEPGRDFIVAEIENVIRGARPDLIITVANGPFTALPGEIFTTATVTFIP